MFVKVTRLPGALEFTVVDIDLQADSHEAITVLHMGVVSEDQVDTWQAWYTIAENLVAADLDIASKRGIARDLTQWLRPLSREILVARRKADLAGLAAIGSGSSSAQLDEPIRLSEDDPLTIVAGWLE